MKKCGSGFETLKRPAPSPHHCSAQNQPSNEPCNSRHSIYIFIEFYHFRDPWPSTSCLLLYIPIIHTHIQSGRVVDPDPSGGVVDPDPSGRPVDPDPSSRVVDPDIWLFREERSESGSIWSMDPDMTLSGVEVNQL